jgi:ABC-type transport system involved in multi-copper enzyme maturation permease subunit
MKKYSDHQNYPIEKEGTNKAPNNSKFINNQNNIMLSNNNLNNTKYLIDDTMGISNNNSLFFSNNSNLKNPIIQSKLNNTQNLLMFIIYYLYCYSLNFRLSLFFDF